LAVDENQLWHDQSLRDRMLQKIKCKCAGIGAHRKGRIELFEETRHCRRCPILNCGRKHLETAWPVVVLILRQKAHDLLAVRAVGENKNQSNRLTLILAQ